MSPEENEVPHTPDGVTGLRLFSYAASVSLEDILNQVGSSLLISTYQRPKTAAISTGWPWRMGSRGTRPRWARRIRRRGGGCFAGGFAFIGLCKIRETAEFGDVPIAARRESLKCGVAVVELASGKLAGLLEFAAGIHEIFAVEVLPGTRCPAISGPFVAKDNTQPIYTMPPAWIATKP
jgi:hypothetical protein